MNDNIYDYDGQGGEGDWDFLLYDLVKNTDGTDI